MKRVGSKTTMLLAATAMIFMSSEAFAWVCTAKNAAGVNFTAVGAVKWRVQARALAKCRVASAHPATCYIAGCS